MTLAMRAYVGGSIFGWSSAGRNERPIVALHGWGRTHTDFTSYFSLGGVTAFDLPGFGLSPAPPSSAGAREYASHLASALAELDAPSIIVGHSFGGRVAVCLAAQHPELVDSLVLVGVPLLRRTHTKPVLTVRLAKTARRWHLLNDEGLRRRLEKHGSSDYKASSGVMRSVLVRTVNEDYSSELESIRCRTVLVWGDRDTAAPVGIAERALDIVQNAELRVLQGGHDVHLTHTSEIVATIQELRS